MAQLWGGRFTKETDEQVYQFNASLSFDRKLYKEDITGSIAHAKMLAKQGIISEQDKNDILDGLNGILKNECIVTPPTLTAAMPVGANITYFFRVFLHI